MNLGSKAVAYLNVDCAVQGPGFFVGATPQLDNLILEVTKKVKCRGWKRKKKFNDHLVGYDLDFTSHSLFE
jgi:hypothetical protein